MNAAKTLQDESLLLRLNNVPDTTDAVTNDVQYHLTCWFNLSRNASKLSTEKDTQFIQEINDPNKILADIEIINIVDSMINRNEFLNMNQVNTTYNNLLGHNSESHVNYKRYLKEILILKVRGIAFSRPKSMRESDIICSNKSQDNAVDSFKNLPDEYNQLFEAAAQLRKQILKNKKWNFSGSFEGFNIRTSLLAFLKWVVLGPKSDIDLSPKRKENVDTTVRNISEVIMKSVKTKRQVNYNTISGNFRNNVETPYLVGLGLYIHQKTRSKNVINTLSDLNLSIPYERVLQIETDIANTVLLKF